MARPQRRLKLLFVLFALALSAAVLRTTWLTTVRASDLSHRAQSQQLTRLTVAGQRGAITDRNGIQLAVSEDATTVFADPRQIRDPRAVARTITPILGVPEPELLAELSDRRRGFVYLKRKLDLDKGEQIKRLRIEGIGTMPESRRRYPYGSVAAQLLGTVGTDGTGLMGLEQTHERQLAGKSGKQVVVKDAAGKPVELVDTQRAVSGKDLRLTIDEPIQERAEAVLQDVAHRYQPKGATAVVMDPATGELLAVASWPTADANTLSAAPDPLRVDRAVATTFEPGSTFKAFTVAGALSDHIVTPTSVFNLPPTITVGGQTIGESHDRGTEAMDTAKILAVSSNVGGVTIGLLLGPERLDGWIRRFGFGSRTGVDLPGEQTGIVPHPNQYSGSTIANVPIGQGIGITPLQLATAYEAFADSGVIHPPHLIAGSVPSGRPVISPQVAGEVAQMLQGVLGPGGTAPEAAVPGYSLAGKTGTAQKPDGHGGYSHTKYVASFIGFAPVANPRILVSVAVDEPQGDIYGGSVAAPAFEQIASFALAYLRIPPT